MENLQKYDFMWFYVLISVQTGTSWLIFFHLKNDGDFLLLSREREYAGHHTGCQNDDDDE